MYKLTKLGFVKQTDKNKKKVFDKAVVSRLAVDAVKHPEGKKYIDLYENTPK